ncbi:MAG: polymer-forming cytoskeletal protein, partial [Gemmatimonadota bacterium]
MRKRMHTTRTGVFLLAGVALAGTAALLLSPLAAQEAQETADARDAIIVSVSMSGDRAALTLSLPDGTERSFRLERGQLFIDEVMQAEYEPDGDLESAWRDLLRSPAVFSPEDLAVALREWKPPAGADEVAAGMLERALQGVGGGVPAANLGKQIGEEEVMVEGPSGDGVSIAPGLLSVGELSGQLERLHSSLERLGEDAASADKMLALVVHDSYHIPPDRIVKGNLALLDGELSLDGTVTGNVLVLDGTLHLMPNAVIEGNILQVGGDVEQHGSPRIDGELLS